MERISEQVMLAWGIRRVAIAFAAGALSVLALPPFNFFAVLFVSIPVLVWLLDGASGAPGAGFLGRLRPAFATGWCFGFGYFTAGLWWLANALLVESDQFAWAVPLAVFGLPAFLAIFYGVAAALARALWSDGLGRIAALAAAFGLIEYARAIILTGFPWNAIGYAAMPVPLMMQSAEIVGLFGMSLLTVFVFAAPALIGTRRGAAPGLALALAFFLVHLGYGAYALHGPGSERAPDANASDANAPVVRIVQPGIDQAAKWDGGERERIFSELLALTAQAPAEGAPRPTYVVWPETAIPFLLTDNPGALSRIADVLQVGQTLITGAVRVEDGQGGASARYYNSIYVIDDEGQIVSAADKAHLVPFGEYLPFGGLLEQAGFRTIAQSFGGYSAAERRTLLNLPGGLRAVPLICYEAIFPEMSEIDGTSGDLIVNVTNDGWYGATPGPYQHLRQAQLRAVETRRPLVRAANTGISAVIDARGQVSGHLGLSATGILDVRLPQDDLAAMPISNREFNFWLIFALMVSFSIYARLSK